MKRSRHYIPRGFTILEILVVLLISSVVIGGIYRFVSKQSQNTKVQTLRSDLESASQIAFFIIGRDIRRAGSNPAGVTGYTVGAELPILLAQSDSIRLQADLNGNGTVDPSTDEDITYQWIDNPTNPDGVKDQIRRQSGNSIVIENVRNFQLQYQITGNTTWVSSLANPGPVRMVRMYLKVGTGHTNPNTNSEDTKEVQMDFLLRNYR